MFLALLFALAIPVDWVPARWASSDPATLELLRETPVNCLVVESANWSAAFAEKAAREAARLPVAPEAETAAERPAMAEGAAIQA